MVLQPAKTTAAAPVAPALPRQTDSKVSQELLDKEADKEAAEKAAREPADKEVILFS